MESLLFMIDACVMVAVVFFSLKNDTLRSGARQIGLFRITDGAAPSAEAQPRDGRRRVPARAGSRDPTSGGQGADRR